jgi:uncharacterized protein YndB with AHSA1/START domain
MIKKILLVALGAIIVLAVAIQFQPATYSVTRSTQINAPPEKVFALIQDFHRWDSWSPWAKLDPKMKTSYQGPDAGPGAIYQWSGNDQVGEGRMTLLATTPPTEARIRLEFIKPFASVAENTFRIASAPSASSVTWTMSGENDFLSKAFCLFMGGMDKAIGPDFEKGLAQMKSVAERP